MVNTELLDNNLYYISIIQNSQYEFDFQIVYSIE